MPWPCRSPLPVIDARGRLRLPYAVCRPANEGEIIMDKRALAVAVWFAFAAGMSLSSHAQTATAADAQSLDYEFFKARVEPIFLQKRPGHTRCVVCHAERSNNAFRLEKLPAGGGWTEEQSRRNYETASRLVVPGKPDSSLLLLQPLAPAAGGNPYHSGRSEEHTSELQSRLHLVCRLLL